MFSATTAAFHQSAVNTAFLVAVIIFALLSQNASAALVSSRPSCQSDEVLMDSEGHPLTLGFGFRVSCGLEKSREIDLQGD